MKLFGTMIKNSKQLASLIFIGLFLCLFCVTGISSSFANNLIIDSFATESTNESSNSITYTANITWENGWRATTNYDAVWLFLKYSIDGGMTWNHASMADNGTNPNGFNASVGFEIIVPSDEKGLFIQRTELSAGDVSAEDVQFVWDYGQDGLTDAQAMASNTVNKVFGVEVVYIPEGSFHAGDGASSSAYRFKQGTLDDDPWYIENEEAITTTTGTTNGYYYQSSGAAGESSNGSVFVIPTSFPKGYQSVYQMKYELTEGQYVEFFNTLKPSQKSTRDISASTEGGKNSDSIVNRNTFVWDATNPVSHALTTRPDRPISYVSWGDVLAYADWAGLRPITEFEYEKAARGIDIAAINNEYAWGKTTYNQAGASEIFPDNNEDGEEQIFDGAANLNRNNLGFSSGDGRAGGTAVGQAGPLRAGIFAESSTNRTTSGAGYYGTMELSGNLSEMVVTVGNSSGRAFLGTHGDGELSSVSSYEGNATNSDWPGINTTDAARGVTGTSGSGYRGGNFNSTNVRYFQTSNRTYAASDADGSAYDQRYDGSFGMFAGGRLGRTAP